MKYGSVCSGIEAASVAWESLGWQAQWYSEIEHFPSAVLAHRFPTVPNLGDMTKLQENKIFNGNSIDLLVGGTPCTSFSVAGLRRGLDDPRGQLMLTFCELAARKRPRWVVWENVPGVLSSNKGEDLASFLGLLTGREIHPPVGGWKNSGVVEGIGSAYGVAWTVLDAQYFGVAQRRRRVFAIGYLGDWRPAAAVLFESYRLSGDIKEGRKKRKATSADAEGSFGGGGQSINTFAGNIESDVAATLQTTCDDYSRADGFNMAVESKAISMDERNIHLWSNENMKTSPALTATDYKGAKSVCHAFKVRGGSEVETGEQGGTPGKKAGKGYLGSDELAFTIGTTQDQQIAQPIAYSFDSLSSNSMKSSNPNSGCREVETSSTIDATTPTPSKNQGGIAIAQPIAFQQNTRDEVRYINGDGSIAGALSASSGMKQTNYVAQPVPFRKARRAQSKDDHETWEQDEKTNTLNAFDTGDIRTTQAVVQPIAVDTYNQTTSNVNQTIKSPQGGLNESIGVVLTPIAVDCYNQTINERTTQTIGSSASDVNHYGAVLTPHLEGNPFIDTFVNKGLNHAGTQERNSVKVLSILREKIGTKAFAQWGLGVFNTLQSTQILQSDLHGVDVRPATFSDSRFIYGSLSCKENGFAWLMQSLREAGCEGCASQGWELSEQYIGELRAYLSELPYERPQSKRFLHDLWEADERFGLLRQALSKIQDTWRSFVGESKSTQTPYAIRRLTPFETEILQGFPRGWTRIPYRNKSVEQCPDGPRYKACGNSMAVPCMFWLGKRIQMVEDIINNKAI